MQQQSTPVDSVYLRNRAYLMQRYPSLAARLDSLPGKDHIRTGRANDGGLYYAVRQDGRWMPLTDPIAPLARIQRILDESAVNLRNYTRPVFVMGLYPGHELITIFQASEQESTPHCPQPLWVCLDSTIALYGLMNSVDLAEMIMSPRVRLFWYEDAALQVQWLREHPEFPHQFTLISAASEATLNKVMPPFAALIQERDLQTEQLKEENNRYYDAIDDEQLAAILRGESGRAPRLLMPTCTWSTFIQYSTRDTCAAFREHGWEVRELNMEAMLTSYHLACTIHEFKPDLFLFIDHMRYEAEDIYPRSMMFVTWIQDEMDNIFCRAAGESMARYAERGRRDLVVGYARQDLCTLYGYPQDRLVVLPLTADTRIFYPVTLSNADIHQYRCELAFMTNAGMSTEQIVEERIVPHVEKMGISRKTVEAVHDLLWAIHRAGGTRCSRVRFLETLCAFDEFRQAYDVLKADGDEDRLLRLFYWKLNDAVYRHVVIEWADQAGIDLHLYGHGWHGHPRFGKYAHGSVVHGSELNKAYQSARWNLHLNITQGMHQRVWEILAAGAAPLFRVREPEEYASPPIAVLRRWADFFAQRKSGQPFPVDDNDEATQQWLFNKASSLAIRYPSITPNALEEKVLELIRNLISSRPDVIVDEWDQLVFNDQASLEHLVRSQPPAVFHLHA